MKCDEVEVSLDLFLDERIDVPQRREIERHLNSCDGCRSAFDNTRSLIAALQTNLGATAPASLDSRVMRAFYRHQHAKNEAEKGNENRPSFLSWFAMSKPAFVLASVILVAATALAFQLGKQTATAFDTTEPTAELVSQIQSPGEKPLVKSGLDDTKGDQGATEPKIVTVPVIEEKIVTRTIYVTRKPKPGKKALKPDERVPSTPAYTALDLKGFQPIAEMKIRITKKEN